MTSALNKRPFPFDSIGNRVESLISAQEQNVRDAQTPEERAKHEALLTMLREQHKWRFVRELPPLFRLYQHEVGRWAAELSSELEAKALSFKAKTHTDKDAEAIRRAVNALGAASSSPPGTLSWENWAKCTYQALHEHLIPRLRAIMIASPEFREVLAKKLKKDLAHAIDSYAAPKGMKAHANAGTLRAKGTQGQAERIEIKAIAIAREYVENHQELPTKMILRELLEGAFPKVKLSEGKWANLWKQAGLDSLPKAERWTKK